MKSRRGLLVRLKVSVSLMLSVTCQTIPPRTCQCPHSESLTQLKMFRAATTDED